MIEWAILMGAVIIASALGKKEMGKRKNFSVKDYVQTLKQFEPPKFCQCMTPRGDESMKCGRR